MTAATPTIDGAKGVTLQPEQKLKTLGSLNAMHLSSDHNPLGMACCTAVVCLLLAACDMIDYHPYDVDVSGETGINATHMAEIESLCLGKDTIRFIAMGDSQRWYDETEDFVESANARGNIDFVIHGGDTSDFGLTDEFMWQRDILNGLDMPYVVLIGNHDYLGTGEEAFAIIFGETNFSFIAGRVKFVCLDTNALENDYSTSIPDFEFMEEELTSRADEFDKTVVCMHIRPYVVEFNNNVASVFEYYVLQYPGIQFCTAAHEHLLQEMDLFGDGIMYYVSDCMKNRSYYVFTIYSDGYEREVVYF